MVRVAFRIFTGDTRLSGPAQQVIACTPPAHCSLEQQSRLPFIGPRLADPDVTSAAGLVHGMANVLVQLGFALAKFGKSALSVTCQQIERRPQQVCAKAVAELLIGNGQGLVNAPAALRSLFLVIHVLSFLLMAALCQLISFQGKKILETAFEECFQ
ncbi:hypothetical protein [Comamonas resistens]|uniref:hypothetical protein n=1 Tax=Comamonas resistens TaxID=3046670 RepID=UPI0039BC43B2